MIRRQKEILPKRAPEDMHFNWFSLHYDLLYISSLSYTFNISKIILMRAMKLLSQYSSWKQFYNLWRYAVVSVSCVCPITCSAYTVMTIRGVCTEYYAACKLTYLAVHWQVYLASSLYLTNETLTTVSYQWRSKLQHVLWVKLLFICDAELN